MSTPGFLRTLLLLGVVIAITASAATALIVMSMTGDEPTPPAQVTLKDGAVTPRTIATGAVSTEKIAPGAVTAAKLADAAVEPGKLSASSVTAGDIAPNAIYDPKLFVPAIIGSREIKDGSITAKDLAAGVLTQVTAAKKPAADPTPAPTKPTTTTVGLDVTVRTGEVTKGTGKVSCTKNEIAISGGVAPDQARAQITLSAPVLSAAGAPTGWEASLSQGGGTIYAICTRA